MGNVDQFESMFRSASREVFQYQRINIESALVVTDLEKEDSKRFADQVREFLKGLNTDGEVRWRDVDRSEFQTVGELLSLVETDSPDIVCTYRNLHSSAWRWPYSLGAHIDVLTQHTDLPVMLLPHPLAKRSAEHAIKNSDRVMAIDDHLTGDHQLVNYAIKFTENGGTLWLTHVEDAAAFERFMEIISKIPTIDTDDAREEIREQLLKEPQDYIDDCVEILQKADPSVAIENIVTFGCHLWEYKRLIARHEIDLLVLNTKDEEQLAMNGTAHALAVELRQIPLLML